tara:strand:- start:179 stop:565 length:387 start_codon:yes stop_codon:yes gene_type:complete
MIDTDKYEGHTEGPWLDVGVMTLSCPICFQDYDGGVTEIQQKEGCEENFILQACDSIAVMLPNPLHGMGAANTKLIAAAPNLLAEVKRLQRELDTQYEYIEWLEEFAPKAGEYNTAWDAYEAQMEEEE